MRSFVRLLLSVGVLAAACSFNGLDELKENADAGASGGAASGGKGGDGGPQGTLPNGALCTTDDSCAAGHCSSGICCDTACSAPCMACVAAAKESGEVDGECGPSKAATDPRGDCPEEAPESCGKSGKCDGLGACQQHAAGTPCGPSSCSAGVKTLPKLCDGLGQCVATGTEPCTPATCNGSVCSSDCVDDTSCASGEYCNKLTGACVAKLGKGENCQAGAQCSTGFCVDGSCCESACSGGCQACSGELTAAASGTCAPVFVGTDPDNDCSDQGPASCGDDGKCDGAGACRKYGSTAICQAATCSGSTQTNAKTCDGNGQCVTNGATECAPYQCGGSTCATSCGSASNCVSGSFCTSGVCQGKKSNGAACGAGQECTSGFCADSVCCNTACAGACQACSAAAKGTGASGSCGNVIAGQDPHNNCTQQAASSCGTDGACNGSGGCRLWAGGTVCAPASCAIDPANNFTYLQTNADTCDGLGKCVDKGTLQCGLLTCGGTLCKTVCATTADCVLGDCISGGTCYFNPF